MKNIVFDVPEVLTSLNFVSVIVRLSLAVALGGIIGLERGRKHRAAGFRTYMIVSLASALIMITNEYLITFYKTGDPARLGAQVISGIGFLGAGSIMIDNMRIKGITTAAGLWGAAGLGLAAGAGFYIGAVLAGLFLFIIMSIMGKVDIYMYAHSKVMILSAEFKSMEHFSTFISETRKMGYTISDIDIKKSFLSQDYIGVTFRMTMPKEQNHVEVIETLGLIRGVKYIEEM